MDNQPQQASTISSDQNVAAAPPPTPPSASSLPPVSTAPPPNAPTNKFKKFLPLIALFILIIGLGFLALWYFQSEKTPKSSTAVASATPTFDTLPETIIVGTDPTYPPMESLENNVMVGYDIDLANFIGKELGVQIKFKNIVFDDLFSALDKKEINVIISTMTITEERKKKYDFSEPYLQGGQVILTKKDNTTIKSTADLKGKKIAVQRGTTIETEALKYTSDDLVIRYPDFVQATTALVSGTVDAIFVDLPGAKGIITANPSLKIASDPFNEEYYAVVFRKDDPCIPQINKALASLKVKGILADLKQEWLDP